MNNKNPSTPKPMSQDLFPILLLAFSVLVLFGKVILSGESLYGSDFVLQFYPWKKFLYDTVINEGALPFWNPYLFSGTPFIANIQASMFYPLGFLYYLLPTDMAYLYSTLLHCILGAVFMYLFMRSLKCARAASFLSGFVFIFNGYFMAHVYAGHLSFVQNYIWIPLVFLFLVKFSNTMKLKQAVLAGLVLAVQILGGFPQIAFYTILAVIAYLLFFSIVQAKNGEYRRVATNGIGLIIILCVGFSVAAVQVIPTLEFSTLSGRAGGVSYRFATSDSLDPSDFLSFLIPDIFGNVVDHTYWKSGEVWHFWETCAYVGILPLLLLFVRIKSGFLRRFRFFCILLILGSLFLALGKHNPLYALVYHLPGFGSFRIPSQIIFLYVFAVSVLSGLGLHGMNQRVAQLNRAFLPFYVIAGGLLLFLTVGLSFFPSDLLTHLFKSFAAEKVQIEGMNRFYERLCFSVDKGVLILFGSALLIFVAKIRKIDLRIFGILTIGIVVIDLYLFSEQLIKPFSLGTPPWKKSLVTTLNGPPEAGRIYSDSVTFMPNDPLRYGFPSITGYDPLILKRYIHYIQSSQGQPLDDFVINLSEIKKPQAKLLQLLNLKEMVIGKKVKFIENRIPYVSFIGETASKSSHEMLSYMNSAQFDPFKKVVFETGIKGARTFQNDTKKVNGSYLLVSYENEKIRLTTSTDQKCFLVLSEIFYPGWYATVDGKSVPLFCGNYIFRVIPLKKGEHEVVFKFVSWPFRFGLTVSLLVLMGSIWIVWESSKSGSGEFVAKPPPAEEPTNQKH